LEVVASVAGCDVAIASASVAEDRQHWLEKLESASRIKVETDVETDANGGRWLGYHLSHLREMGVRLTSVRPAVNRIRI
jgi:hypothetical protein